jgi:hypothetical protein
MKAASICIILLTIFLITDCEKAGTAQNKIDFGTPVSLRTGTVYSVTNSLSVKIDSIKDSRCPLMAECFWAGYVGLYFNINNNSRIDTLIYFQIPLNNPFFIDNYKLEVLGVEPHSEHGELINQEDYLVSFIIKNK